MRLKEFTAPKDTVLTQAGINPNPDVDADTHNPDGRFSPLGTEQDRPVPLTANHAVEVDEKVKELKKLKESNTRRGRYDKFTPTQMGQIVDLNHDYSGSIRNRPDALPGLGLTDVVPGFSALKPAMKLAKVASPFAKKFADAVVVFANQFGTDAAGKAVSHLRNNFNNRQKLVAKSKSFRRPPVV